MRWVWSSLVASLIGLILTSAAASQGSLNVTGIGQITYAEGANENLVVSGSYAYLASAFWYSWGGLRIVDISHPNAPIDVGFCYLPNWALGVAVSGVHAYVACGSGSNGLCVVNVSNPAAPYIEGVCATQGGTDVTVSGSYAYVAAGNGGLLIVDVSDPAMPVEVGCCSTPAWAEDVALSGSYAYVAAYSAGLRVIDVSNPTNPFEVGYCSLPSNAEGVAVSGFYAYVANYVQGLRVIDISNPAAPFETGWCSIPGSCWDVAVSGSSVYLASEIAGLRVVDVSTPATPTQVGWQLTPSQALAVAISRQHVFVATYSSLCIYQFSLPSLTITMTPLNPPILIPAAGGSFHFSTAIINEGVSTASCYFWLMARLPDSTWHGPLLEPLSLTVLGGDSMTSLRNQDVPGSVPAGTYWYEARVGYYPSAIIDTTGFAFTKLAGVSSGSGAEEWENTGKLLADAGVGFGGFDLPLGLAMSVSPNPFNPTTTISYQLPEDSHVSLKVFDISGRPVVTLADGWREAGVHEVRFDGNYLSSGIYFARLTTGDWSQAQKLVLMK